MLWRSPHTTIALMCILVRGPINTQHPYSLCLQAPKNAEICPPDLVPRLCKHFIGIGRNHGILVLAAGGISNDSHLPIALPANVPVAKAIQVFKANSSYWLRENGMEFAWQEGYGRSASAVPLATPSKTRLRIKRNTIRSELTNENSKRWYGNLEWRLSRRMRLGRMPSLRGLGLLQAFPALPCRAFTFRTFAPIY